MGCSSRFATEPQPPQYAETVALLSENRSLELSANFDRLAIPEALPALAGVLRSPTRSDRVRKRAATVIGMIGTASCREVLIGVLEQTDRPSGWEDGRELWSRILDAIAHCVERESTKQLRRNLDHENPYLRWLAATELGKRKDSYAVEKLITLLNDPHPDPRLGATWALGEIQHPRGVHELIAIVEGHRSGGSRVSAIEAMGKIATPRAVEALRSVQEDDPAYRTAEEALKKLSKPIHPDE